MIPEDNGIPLFGPYNRAGFRHGQEGQLPRTSTKRGAPTNEGPCAKADSNKGSPRQKGSNALSVSPLEWWLSLSGAPLSVGLLG
jgi:hypothetical protein